MRDQRRSRTAELAPMLLALLAVPTVGVSETGTARGRVIATVRAATSYWSEATAVVHDAAAREARARSEGAPDSPFVMVYLEGLGVPFEHQANAQDTVQAVIPFNLPGQSSAARGYTEAATAASDLDRATVGVHAARAAGRAWVERAAWMERVEVRRRRLARIDEALALHEARFLVGEVAGTEVVQLDLEHVRETSAVAEAQAESARRAARLTELCGDGCVEPLLGDLQELVLSTETPRAEELTVESIEAGGLLSQARAATAAAAARADLISSLAYGRPSVGLDWEHFRALDGLPSYDAWGLMLSLPLPVGRAGKQQKAAAQAEVLASRERVEGQRRELLRRAIDARNDAEAAAQRLAAVNTVLSQLGEIERSLVLQFRLGAISYLAYMDGMSRLDEVRLDAVAACESLLLARLELATIIADPAVFPVPTVVEEEG